MNLRKVSLWLAIPALLLAVGLAAWSWLLHSDSGARWLFSRLKSSIPASIGSSGISGSLGSGLQLAGFYFDDRNTRIDAATLTIAVDIDLFPLSISLETLQAASVVARTLQVSGPETETDWGSTIEGLSLPVPLVFGDIRVSDIEYFDLSGESALIIHSLVAAGRLHRDLVLDRLAISLPGSEVAVSGQLGLSAPQPLSLEFRLGGDLDLTGKLDGSLESAQIMLDSGTPNLRVRGTLGQLLQVPAWDLEISSTTLQWPLQGPEPDVKLSGLKARSSGQWQQFNLELAGELELQELEPSRLELLGNGSGSSFTAQRLTIDGADLSLQAAGTISWKDQLQLGLDAVLERLEPGKWLDGWPENHPVNGELAVSWGGDELEVSDFTLAVAHTTLSASGHGVLDIPSGILEAELNWNDFSWPPGNPDPVVHSRIGSFQVSGKPENWKLDGSLALQAGEFPEGQLQMSGAGDLESLELKVHKGTILGGTLSGNAHWNWTETQPFNTVLAIENIDFTPLLPQYPAVLSAHLTAGGELQPFRLGVEIQQLDGTIQDFPIQANGGFHIEQGRTYADQLNLVSGASSLSLDGGLYEPDGMEFSANIDSLARFANESSGSVSAQGSISLYPESPVFSATLSARHLALGPLEIAQIETREGSGTGVDAGPEVVLSGVVIGQRPIESVSFRFGGERPLEHFAMKALIEGTQIDLGLNGSVNDWTDPLASGWSGSLSELRLEHQAKFALALDQAADIELGPSHFSMEPACFSGTREARMCLESAWNSPDELQLSADLAAIPVGLVELLTDTDVTFTQVLAGTFNWSQAAGGARSGGARIEISPGDVKDIDDGEVLLQTGPGLFGFEVIDGNLQRGNLDINFPQSGNIDIDFSLPELRSGLDSPVRGTAKIDLSDIGSVGLFLPLFDTIDGVVDVDLNLSGTLSDPAFKGRAALSNGQLENSASGLSLTDINLSGEVSELDRAELKGSFRAGEGSGEISTSIYFEDILAPVANLALKGEALTVIDVPELKVIANPDLALSWQDNQLEINGRLHIPTARLAPTHLPQSTVRQSNDVVVVAGEVPVVEEDFLEENAVSLGGKLEIELGDEVVIDLDLAQLRVTGKTEFAWTDDMIPIANGNFDATGEIQAFGQLLRVTRGRIGFPGTPADNPHLNIRAEREIFGNSQVRRAGLMVAGTLRRPVVEAYTVPMTNKERAQTLLVTGSDFNYEQGVGAVDVGMYVLPRLYISYGIGVFEDGNVIKARYDLGRGFGIRATSGQRETGLDISYTIER